MAEKISGYRNLDESEVDIVNRIKAAERELGELWREVGASLTAPDGRWLAVAKTHFQEGFSAFVRAATRPEDVF